MWDYSGRPEKYPGELPMQRSSHSGHSRIGAFGVSVVATKERAG